MSIYYEIEVNVARKGAEPIWRELEDEYGDPCRWVDEDDARAALADENRGDNARILRFVAGFGQPI